MQTIINTRDDLDAMKGTPEYAQAMRYIAGSCQYYQNEAPAGQMTNWVLKNNLDSLRRFELNESEVVGYLSAPEKPENYVTDDPNAPKKAISSLDKLRNIGLTLDDLVQLIDEAQSIIKKTSELDKERGA